MHTSGTRSMHWSFLALASVIFFVAVVCGAGASGPGVEAADAISLEEFEPMQDVREDRPSALRGFLVPDPIPRREFVEKLEEIDLLDRVADRPDDSASLDLLKLCWERYASRINELVEEAYPEAYEISSTLATAGQPFNREQAGLVGVQAELMGEIFDDLSGAERRLFHCLMEIAEDDDVLLRRIERWQLQRQWSRYRSRLAGLPGCRSVHLSKLLEAIELQWPDKQLQRAYEVEIARAARRWLRGHLDSMGDLARLRAEAMFDEHNERYAPGSAEAARAGRMYQQTREQIHRQHRVRHQQRIVRINERYMEVLADSLSNEDAERVRMRYWVTAFPDHFPDPYDLRPIIDELVDEDKELPEQVRDDLVELRTTYAGAADAVHERLMRTVMEEREAFESRVANHRADREEHAERLDDLKENRRQLAAAYALEILELLDDADASNDIRSSVRNELDPMLDHLDPD